VAGMNQLELAPLRRDWIESVTPRVLLLVGSLEEFTSDDLHPILGEPAMTPNHWGILMARLKNTGRIVKCGYRPSTRKSANGRPIAVWRRA
jgi:hypothetical protein